MSDYIERDFNNVMITYDRDANALYIGIDPDVETCMTIRLVEDVVNIDADHLGNVSGIEVLL